MILFEIPHGMIQLECHDRGHEPSHETVFDLALSIADVLKLRMRDVKPPMLCYRLSEYMTDSEARFVHDLRWI